MSEETTTNTTPLNLEEEPKVVYIERQRVGFMSGFNKVLEILANKISKKAALIALAMVLVYFLAITPPLSALLTVNTLLLVMAAVCILALIGVLLQFAIDYMNAKTRDENSSSR